MLDISIVLTRALGHCAAFYESMKVLTYVSSSLNIATLFRQRQRRCGLHIGYGEVTAVFINTLWG